jgi:molecular chaperone GrpE
MIMSDKKTDTANNKASQEPDSIPASEASPAEMEKPADTRDQEITALKDQLLRLQADFDNYRKRIFRDREEQSRRACESILNELLPVVDHFELGLRSAQKHHVKHMVIEGMAGVLKQLEQVLEKAGVTKIETKQQPFDPRLHECVAHIHSDELAENMIIEETRRGYLLGSFLLRASQVIVSNGPATPSADNADDAATSDDD